MNKSLSHRLCCFHVTSMYFAIRHQNKLSTEYWKYYFRGLCVKIGMHDFYWKGPIYSGSTSSMAWLLMTWFLVSLGHQQPWQSKWEICRSLTTAKKDFHVLFYFNALGNGVQFSKCMKIIRYAKRQYINYVNIYSNYELLILIWFH